MNSSKSFCLNYKITFQFLHYSLSCPKILNLLIQGSLADARLTEMSQIFPYYVSYIKMCVGIGPPHICEHKNSLYIWPINHMFSWVF